MESLLLFGVILLMIFGTVAAFLPVVPGPALVWFGAMIYWLGTHFQGIGIVPIVILTLLMILGSTSNLWLAALGVKVVGGSGWGVVGGTIGMLIGLPFLFPIGSLVGALIGALLIEYQKTKNWRQALKVGGGTVGGFLAGVVAEFFIALIMDIVFITALVIAHPI